MTRKTKTNFVSVADAAKILGMTPGRVRQLLADESIQGHKLSPRAWVIEISSVEKFDKKSTGKIGRPRIGKK